MTNYENRDEIVKGKFNSAFRAVAQFYEKSFGMKMLNTTVMEAIMKPETSHAYFGASTNVVQFPDGKKCFTKKGIALKFHIDEGMSIKIGNYIIKFENVACVNTSKDAVNYIYSTKNVAYLAAGDWTLIYWGKPISNDGWNDGNDIFEFICVRAGGGFIKPYIRPRHNENDPAELTKENMDRLVRAMQNNSLKFNKEERKSKLISDPTK